MTALIRVTLNAGLMKPRSEEKLGKGEGGRHPGARISFVFF